MSPIQLVRHSPGAPGLRWFGLGPDLRPCRGLLKLQRLLDLERVRGVRVEEDLAVVVRRAPVDRHAREVLARRARRVHELAAELGAALLERHAVHDLERVEEALAILREHKKRSKKEKKHKKDSKKHKKDSKKRKKDKGGDWSSSSD